MVRQSLRRAGAGAPFPCLNKPRHVNRRLSLPADRFVNHLSTFYRKFHKKQAISGNQKAVSNSLVIFSKASDRRKIISVGLMSFYSVIS